VSVQNVDKLKALHEIGQTITSQHDLDLLLPEIVEAASLMLDCEEIMLFLADDRDEVLYARAQKTDTSELPRLISLKTSDSLIVNVFRTGDTARLEGDKLHIATGLLGTAMLAVQVGHSGERLGVLAACNWTKDRSFSQEDEYFLSAVSSYAAIAIRNSRIMRHKDVLAITDGLTGLYNRRAFDDALHNEVSRALRYGTPVGLILLDIDSFKEFNEQHGHQAGDERLIHLATVLREQLRESDSAFRIGGDEFAVLAPQADSGSLPALADRVHKAVLFQLPDPPPQRVTSSGYTVSIGAANNTDKYDTAEKLFYRADQSLLEAKKVGGNTVIIAALERKILFPFG
jgi:diguanylate cyclase (GGDEF)-like protein